MTGLDVDEVREQLRKWRGKWLCLSNKHIGDDGTKALCDKFMSSETLEQLHLGNNSIGDEGIKQLCNKFLRGNKTLTKLDLRSNRFRDEGKKALRAVLSDPDSLVALQQLWF